MDFKQRFVNSQNVLDFYFFLKVMDVSSRNEKYQEERTKQK